MASAEVDLEMDDLFGDGQSVEENLDQPMEPTNAEEAPEGPNDAPGQGRFHTEGDGLVCTRRSVFSIV